MRVIILAVLVFATTSCQAYGMFGKDPELAKKYREECIKETKIDASLIGEGKPDPKLFENHDFRCFTKCMGVKFGIANEQGDPQFDKIKEVFGVKEGDEAYTKIKKCAEDNTQADVCDKVFERSRCIMKGMKPPA